MSDSRMQANGHRALLLGAALVAIGVVAAFADAPQFFRSYLFAWLYWLGMALGGFCLLMLHHLVGGRWGFPVRRFFEAGTRTLPVLAICFLPLIFGLHDLYAWAQPAAVHASAILQKKQAILNVPFFLIRMVIYFAIWIWMSRVLHRWSHRQDSTSDPEPTRRLRSFSGPGICLFFLIATFADVDLVLSLEPDWYSTVFAAIVIVGNTLGTLALAVVLLALWSDRPPYARLLSPEVWHHLGNLLLAFVMLWAYLAFSQLLVIYSGNLPHEIVWYLHRCSGGWKIVGLILGLSYFAIPFAVLLSRRVKRQAVTLGRIAGLILAAHVLDVWWMVVPAFEHSGVQWHWQDLYFLLALGVLWGGAFLHYLTRESLVPLNDPRLPQEVAA
jgi:FtsH-binding integral membrane protein